MTPPTSNYGVSQRRSPPVPDPSMMDDMYRRRQEQQSTTKYSTKAPVQTQNVNVDVDVNTGSNQPYMMVDPQGRRYQWYGFGPAIPVPITTPIPGEKAQHSDESGKSIWLWVIVIIILVIIVIWIIWAAVRSSNGSCKQGCSNGDHSNCARCSRCCACKKICTCTTTTVTVCKPKPKPCPPPCPPPPCPPPPCPPPSCAPKCDDSDSD